MLEMLPWSNFSLCTVEQIIMPFYIGTPCSSNIYFRICHKIYNENRYNVCIVNYCLIVVEIYYEYNLIDSWGSTMPNVDFNA